MSTETQVEIPTQPPLAEELSKTADLLKPRQHTTARLLVPQKRKAKAAKVKTKAKKAKATKAKKAKAAKAKKPVSGQSGPAIESLPWSALNKKEKRVVGCFELEGEGEIRTIESLAKEAFPHQPAKKANSWVRNSLRRPVRANWLEKVKPGEYRLTEAGRKRLARAES